MAKLKFATVWLGGCSGCHMSFLDLDEWLIDLADRVEVSFTPLADVKTYPDEVDLCLVEGAVANEENLAMARRIRETTRFVVSFGDCAVTGNVTALRNPLGLALEVLRPVYVENGDSNARIPDEKEIVPVLLDKVLPLHQVIPVDFFLPGCPPTADRIRAVLQDLLDGKAPSLPAEQRSFG
jgi:NAD-reducing hydrogenase small subunit